jgi:hypothetical protein
MNAAATLGELAFFSDENAVTIVAAGAIPLLVKAMRAGPQRSAAQQSALLTLKQLGAMNAANRAAVNLAVRMA